MKLSFWLQQKFDMLEIEMNLFALVIIYLLVGFLMMVAFNIIFTFASDITIRQITKLLPDRPYAVWFTRIYSIAFCTILIFYTFGAGRTWNSIYIYVVLVTVMMRSVYINIFLTNENLLVKKLSAEANMSEKAYRAEIKLAIKEKKDQIKMIARIKKKVYELNREDSDD
ncbi:hypothetical protein [Pedobacter sp. ok626]|uniref:hypothetical protein n=1 Tax=Pedobacter sp. ok626 TaxID=1761882 RepID=UPI001053366E|nr:hypothetical protein [Pedobacter sp. ok626]